ncbi:Protein TIFY 10A [Platanthera guangdongensis]|uniref:Protein TIFY n=1 Tax=Platanthera guangdongensis TaxID=2320717 RepID=A0ABR2N009_9ASPA
MTNGVETAKRPEKSSFSVTCSLLSQFIKEKGSLAELGLGLPPRSLDCPPLGKRAAEKSQLTIFYAGKVMVFDNFPSEKARDLMQFASGGQNLASGDVAPAPAVPVANTPSCPATAKPPANFPPRAQPNFSDLPIARKASLHRFLEKRKDRISAKTPYQLSSSNETKDSVVVKEEEISQPWLGLGPQMSTMRLNSNCTR